MLNTAAIKALIKKDVLTEWRIRYTINGILIQTIASVFVVFLSLKIMNAPTWNAIFWVMLLFAATNAVAKGFVGESKGRLLYYYHICSPADTIIAKTIYNTLYMILISAICFGVYALLLGNMAQHMIYYIVIVLLGSIGFSSAFTLISSIAAKSGNGHLMMPVLGFPIIIPLILVLIKASKKAVDGLDVSLIWPDLGVLLAFDSMLILLAYLLFPFVWKD